MGFSTSGFCMNQKYRYIVPRPEIENSHATVPLIFRYRTYQIGMCPVLVSRQNERWYWVEALPWGVPYRYLPVVKLCLVLLDSKGEDVQPETGEL